MKPRTPRLRNDASATPFRRDDDRGAAFIEFLFAIPFLMIMVFGIVETGLAWRAVVQVHSAVRAGARVASKDGANSSADFDALAAISAALPSDLKDSSLRIVIFKANGVGATVPNGCLSPSAVTSHGSSSDNCNTYTVADLSKPIGSFGCGIDSVWCPANRKTDLTNDNIDYVGVYIEAVHQNQTHTYFGNFTIKRSVVFRLEPALP
jgi:Flp pilus assembly protein TadG